MGPITVLDHILDSYYRVADTVPTLLYMADKYPEERDLWLRFAKEERGHDKLLLNDLANCLGEETVNKLLSETEPSAELKNLLAWVREDRINCLVYKKVFEESFVSASSLAVRNFYRQFLPTFITIHELEDLKHSKEITMLLGSFPKELVQQKENELGLLLLSTIGNG